MPASVFGETKRPTVEATQDLLLEQQGKTTVLDPVNTFTIDLPAGGSDPTPDPLPDFDD